MEKLNELAYKISELLTKYQCHIDVNIYFNGKRLSTTTKDNYGKWVEQKGYIGSNYTKFANDDTITMTFEGEFYEVINYGLSPTLLGKFDKLIESYGYYYEIGEPWNLALYKL